MAEKDLDEKLAETLPKEDQPRRLCVWSQGKVFEFPEASEAIVSADHNYLEIRFKSENEPEVVLGGFLGLWGYKWR